MKNEYKPADPDYVLEHRSTIALRTNLILRGGIYVLIPVSNEVGEDTDMAVIVYSHTPNKTTEAELLDIAKRLMII